MRGINFSKVEQTRQRIQRFVSLLDDGWIDTCIHLFEEEKALSPRHGSLGEGATLVKGLRNYEKVLDDIKADRQARSVQSVMTLARTAYIVTEASELPGGKDWIEKLRSYAAAIQFGQFFDQVWEGQAALCFRDIRGVTGVKFESGSHPDLWVRKVGKGEFPIECKRIAPLDPVNAEIVQFTNDLFELIRQLADNLVPLKTIVWLHERPNNVPVEKVLNQIKELLSQAVDSQSEDTWFSKSNDDGTFQVSVAATHDNITVKRDGIDISEIPHEETPQQAFRVSAISDRIPEHHEETPLQAALQVRSDVLPKPIGAFERNLDKAIDQISRSVESETSGIAAIHLRPPRGKGDLYEADRIVRRNLAGEDRRHIALVALFWLEEQQVSGSTLYDASGAERTRQLIYTRLKTYFIRNPNSPQSFIQYDSLDKYFDDLPKATLRSPDTGELVPIDPDIFANEVPVVVASEQADPQSDTFVGYIELERPYGFEAIGTKPEFVTVGERRFGIRFGPKGNMRVFEVRGEELTRMATIDLRQFQGERELCYVLDWDREEWLIKVGSRDHPEWLNARSVPVRGVYT